VGQRFEDRWTAHTILKILKGEADRIYLERIDTDETGFEFEIAAGGLVEHHQVKRQISGDSGWRLKDLRVVLQAFRSKLEDPQALCVFASGNAVQVLDDLSTDARNAADYDTFEKGVLSVNIRVPDPDGNAIAFAEPPDAASASPRSAGTGASS
jgi:hypothetical protein